VQYLQAQLDSLVQNCNGAPRILVTGSEGLIGSRLCELLEQAGCAVVRFDTARTAAEDVCDARNLNAAAQSCTGIVHLAAVSRVVWGEQDPEKCWQVNAEGTHNAVKAALGQSETPWLIYSSSREVYGEPESLPVDDDSPTAPVNIYGRAKTQGEEFVQQAADANQIRAAVLRFSNVYGSIGDHHDRVVPAFARAAATHNGIIVNGRENTFDFTHLEDTVAGICAVANYLQTRSTRLGPTHFTTGTPTSLEELAMLAKDHADGDLTIDDGPNRTYDVAQFYADPRRAREELGWVPTINIETGFADLVDRYRRNLVSTA